MGERVKELRVCILALVVALGGCASEESSSSGDQDIVGGVAAAPGAWPGVVGLTDTSRYFKCGGSLVADTWVLTAAHCLDRSKDNGGLLRALIGRTRLDVVEGDSRAVLRAIAHPSYSEATHDNDIALIELDAPSGKAKALLAPAAQASLAAGGATATVVGWGATKEKGSTNNVLRQVSVPLISNTECQASPGLGGVTKNMLCAGYRAGGGDACQGDSGGPLYSSSSGTILQIGIVSFGIGCAHAGQPGVYTRVSPYLDWIAKTSGGAVPVEGTPNKR